ncbi:MAG: DUF2750 domain-containing protein [Saprospiraceae bacterium]|nr:DUF2750 domain-containing protein [Saprospiraceae bacterium]MDW8229240.1 DUF2750 domain-containing protein [Saprospiraceae bacterium]
MAATGEMTSKQIDEILAKKPLKRYAYTIRTLLEEEELWGLFDGEGWLLMDVDADAETSAFVLFPHEAFAEIFRNQAGYEDYAVTSLDLHEFMEWLEDFEQENILVAVFPTPDLEATVVSAAKLKAELLEAFEKEEDNE